MLSRRLRRLTCLTAAPLEPVGTQTEQVVTGGQGGDGAAAVQTDASCTTGRGSRFIRGWAEEERRQR